MASKFLAVGSAVPAAVAGVGAVATQAEANVAYKGLALSHLDEGATAEVALQRLLEEDDGRPPPGRDRRPGRERRQPHRRLLPRLGRGRDRRRVAIQGNILAGPEVVEAMKTSWDGSAEEADLGRRLLAALVAGDRAGGDSRGRQSAALVVRDGAGYGGTTTSRWTSASTTTPTRVPSWAGCWTSTTSTSPPPPRRRRWRSPRAAHRARRPRALAPATSTPGSARELRDAGRRRRLRGAWVDRRVLAILRDTSGDLA